MANGLPLAQALRTGVFWKIFVGMFTCGFSMNLLGTHGMPMLMDHGFDAHSSSLGIGLIGFVAIFGTLVLGPADADLGRGRVGGPAVDARDGHGGSSLAEGCGTDAASAAASSSTRLASRSWVPRACAISVAAAREAARIIR